MPARPNQTVGALIETLRDLPEGAVVLLSSDSEGNRFRPLDGIDHQAAWDNQARDITFPEDGPSDRYETAVVLFPEH